jgi:hypothetical protein
MFEHLGGHRRIIVTGPQRSGTTICARMIAQDTGHEYIDENVIAIHDHLRLRYLINRHPNPFVIQAPGMAHLADHWDAFIVWMVRPVAEILASERRIGWEGEWRELAKYPGYEGPAAVRKYTHWEEFQREQVKEYIEVDYRSLSAHPLWVPKDRRKNFEARQWEE